MSDARYETQFTVTTTERGKVVLKVMDRINVDDVFVHLVNRELYRLVTGNDTGSDVPQNFKDVLVKTKYSAG
jgi:hypothetical protein